MKINLHTWFTERKLNYLPTHFVKCNAEVTEESLFWVYEILKGRFYTDTQHSLFYDTSEIYFEDPQEAMLFELKWS